MPDPDRPLPPRPGPPFSSLVSGEEDLPLIDQALADTRASAPIRHCFEGVISSSQRAGRTTGRWCWC